MDLSKLSDADLMALKANDLSKVSDEGLAVLSGKTTQAPVNETPFQAFVRGLKSPVLPEGRTAVVGPAIAGALGETAKGIGAATQLVAPEAGQPLVDIGKAMVQGASKANPVTTTLGQIGSYVAPTMAGQKGLTAAHEALGLAPGLGLRSAEGALLGGGVNLLTTPTEEGRGTSGALGAAIGAASPVAGNIVGKALNPQTSPEVQKLINEGVTLTPGQIMGGMLKSLEDKAMSLPIVGETIRGARNRATEQFNKAAYKRALEPIAGEVPEVTGREGVRTVKEQLSNAYDQLLPKLTFIPDNVFAQNLATLDKNVVGLSPKGAQKIQEQVSTLINDRMPKNGLIDGNSYKVIESDLSTLAKEHLASTSASDKAMGRGYETALADLRSALARGNPEYADQLSKINTGFANYARIRQAGSMANTQERFTPSQLAAAVKAADKSAGKGATASGQALMQDLTDAGIKVIPSVTPDSGTATRLLATDPYNYLIGGALATPYTQVGGKLTQSLLTQRPESIRALAEALKKQQGAGLGTALGVERKIQGE